MHKHKLHHALSVDHHRLLLPGPGLYTLHVLHEDIMDLSTVERWIPKAQLDTG